MLRLHVTQDNFTVFETDVSEPIISFDCLSAAERFIADVLALDTTPIAAAGRKDESVAIISTMAIGVDQSLLVEGERIGPHVVAAHYA